MQGKIAIEEHFAMEETLSSSEGPHGASEAWNELRSGLLDIQDRRLARMDKLGIEIGSAVAECACAAGHDKSQRGGRTRNSRQ